ncbi:MAG: hypothetical protein QXX77_09060 [Candidatus Methanosuratincola sp.]
MTRISTLVRISTLCLAALATAGCRTQDMGGGWGWSANRPKTMQETFSHEVHKEVLKKEGFECYVCHPAAIKIEGEKEAEEAIRASKESFFPGKETCHFCHYNPQSGSIAPDQCSLCHFNIREIQPANHNVDWLARHAVYSKADAAACEDCHSPRYCEDCHKRRDLPTRRFHDRTFRFIHGIEARANPMKCGQCHESVSFCEKCHVEGGYER